MRPISPEGSAKKRRHSSPSLTTRHLDHWSIMYKSSNEPRASFERRDGGVSPHGFRRSSIGRRRKAAGLTPGADHHFKFQGSAVRGVIERLIRARRRRDRRRQRAGRRARPRRYSKRGGQRRLGHSDRSLEVLAPYRGAVSGILGHGRDLYQKYAVLYAAQLAATTKGQRRQRLGPRGPA